MKNYFVYLLASQPRGTLYLGVTSDLVRRVAEHRNGTRDGFTEKYGVHRLVWYEQFFDVREAIAREKKLKKWRRAWKVSLIEERNVHWDDLYPGLLGMTPNELAALDRKHPG